MKVKAIISVLSALLFNTFIALAVSIAFNLNPAICLLAANTAGLLLGFVKQRSTTAGLVFNAILREIALGEIASAFYPDTAWLTKARNLDSYVSANTIDLAEAGIDPEVLYNNTTYPIAIIPREDNNLSYTLDTLDTENTPVTSLEQLLSSYDKRQDVMRSHRDSLRTFAARKAAHAFAPAGDTPDTPVFGTSGTPVNPGEFKPIRFNDLIDMRQKFAERNFLSKGGRLVCLLHPTHTGQLMKEDLTLFKALLDITAYKPTMFAGIEIYEYTDTPVFSIDTLNKKAFGAVAGPTDSPATSTFFVDNEVMRCDGSYDVFMREKDPEYRADIIGFQKRFLALPIRQKAIGAIVSVA